MFLKLIFLLSFAAGPSAATAVDRVTPPLCPGCNVVLVSFDALQAAHVHSLGYPRDTTPTIDRFAKNGALFTQAISAAPWTVPATMSWFTGVSPSTHRVVNKFADGGKGRIMANLQKLSPGLKTITQVLKDAGYATGGFTGDAGVNGKFGFSAGFDVYSDSVPPFSGLDRSAPAAMGWIKRVNGGKFFLFLHGYDVHGQYEPRGGFDRRYVAAGYSGRFDGDVIQQRELRERGLAGPIDVSSADVTFWRAIYDEKIARADAQFSAFVSSMDAIGVSSRTVWVLASDHGTEFFEHQRMDHGATLYDELERVLFVVVSPGVKSGAVITQQVSMLDLMPTILDIVGVDPGKPVRRQMQGRSLVPLLTGKSSSGEDVYMETDYRLYTHKRGLRTEQGWKFIYTMESKRAELYNLHQDPRETIDLSGSKPRLAYELEQRLFAHYASLGADLDERDWALGCSPVYDDQCR